MRCVLPNDFLVAWSKDVPIIQSDELTLPSTPTEYLALTYNYQTTLVSLLRLL